MKFTACVCACLLTMGSALASAAPGPLETVQEATAEVLRVLRDPEIAKSRRWESIVPIVRRHFDFRAMSQSILATRWQSASRGQQEQFTEFFSQYIEGTYRAKIEQYTNQDIRFLGENVRGDRAVVDTVIVTEQVEIPVKYRMRRNASGKWRAYDLVIEGVSLVSNYRQTYAAIGKASGINGILADMKSRRARYAGAGASEKRKTTTQ